MFSIFTKQKSFPVRTIEQLKNSVEILFIDNEEFNLTKELKEKDGWKRIKCVTDIKSLSQPELKDAHILCVDIQGVGKELGLVDEGLGLIAAIHDNYPEKKSANRYQFETALKRLAQEAFCLDNCAIHLQRVFQRELGVELTKEEIKNGILKLYSKGKSDNQSICKVFNIDRAGSVASIISLLISL